MSSIAVRELLRSPASAIRNDALVGSGHGVLDIFEGANGGNLGLALLDGFVDLPRTSLWSQEQDEECADSNSDGDADGVDCCKDIHIVR
eukprot:CAMPEP_0183768890 /NCGR_PEP_ID=MMETSP0739-20130205/19215_1 /TAXON_ID=385413 /ORGANISM="Thalassiosira miniscula, Strain CCMP1093" /LENGTH=88 /DNA_ID=CAMNT_0026008313 /DNA_START=304 /DNA_END=566 /DNA_ORIENTATION=-